VVPIAAIQSSPSSYVGQIVTVEGAVTLPINYRGLTSSGYIQDGSGRGINLFGGTVAPPNSSALGTVGNRVQVRGEVAIFQTTTVELINIESVVLIGPGTPVRPIRLGAAAANDARWEGTLIEVAGTVQSSTATGTTARNYTITDGAATIVARVYTALGIPQIADGTAVIGRGAGTNFSGTYQFYVGQAADFAAGTPPPDTQPPEPTGAWAPSPASVQVTFTEAVDPATGGTAGNYEVFESALPGNAVAVATATVAGPVVTLALSSNLAASTEYTVRVSNVQDLAVPANAITTPVTSPFTSPAGDTTAPTLAAAAASDLSTVTATFSEAIDPATGGTPANYTLALTSPPNTTVPIASISVSGAIATLTLGSSLAAGTGYTLTVQNVEDLAGNPMLGQQSMSFTTAGGGTTTPIADIHANLRQYKGRSVTVRGQIYIPTNYRQTTTYTGFVQDASGRGINLFGSSMNNALLQDIGNIVTVTATVDTYFTTIELVNATSVTLFSSGNPPLAPRQLSTGAAADRQWEGTYIEVTGPITAPPTSSGGATNYTVNDGSGNVVVRVADGLGAPSFNQGDRITGRGAGSQFQQDFQVLVGNTSDIGLAGGDVTPPSVIGATTPTLTQVTVSFSEAVTTGTGNNAGNYSVYETSNPGATVAITGATLAANRRSATLALGAALVAGRSYTASANNLADDTGNTMTAPSTAVFTASVGPQTTPIADIHANLRQYKGRSVTVQGQIYIPTNYRGSTTSGYLQDGSGRGINLFGSSANNSILQDIGNIVTVTATVDTYFTTIELVNLTTIALVSSGNPPLEPRVLETGEAGNRAWEGTYIQCSGTVIAKSTTGSGTSAATNYTMDDGSGSLVARVVDILGAAQFEVGQTITARGAGSQFQSDFQILVGRQDAIFLGGAPPPAGGGGKLSISGPPFTFLPRQGESYPITFSVPANPTAGGEVLLRIFDLRGQLKRTLFDNRFDRSGTTATRTWDGRDELGQYVPAGTYVAHLVVTPERTGGSPQEAQMPVVVASRLDR
jgi:hypothetical protein